MNSNSPQNERNERDAQLPNRFPEGERESPIAPRTGPRWLWGGALLLLSGGLLVVTTQAGDVFRPHRARAESPTPAAGAILPVETVTVNAVESYPVSRMYAGEIVARRSSELGFERAGKLVKIAVDQGQRIQAGAPLAYLETSNLDVRRRELRAQKAAAIARLQEMEAGPRSEVIAAARATVQDLQAQLELASLQRTRREWLYTQGAIARESLDEVDSERSVLQARLDAAQSRLDELLAGTRPEQLAAQRAQVQQIAASIENIEVELSKSVLKAPFSGTIASRRVDEGTVVDSGQAVLRLVEDGQIEAHIGVPTAIAARLPLGSRQTVNVDGMEFAAAVVSKLPEVDRSTRTLTVVFELPASAVGRVNPGQVARLAFQETIASPGYWLPTSALVQGVRGLWSCYAVVSENGATYTVERRDVEILKTESDRVLVRGTLQAGDRIVRNGTHRLVPGQAVKPL